MRLTRNRSLIEGNNDLQIEGHGEDMLVLQNGATASWNRRAAGSLRIVVVG